MKQSINLKTLRAFSSKDVTRYHLNGIYLDKTHAVSTDGHRLLMVQIDKDINLSILAKQFEPNTIINTNNLKIDAKFPNYQIFIPQTTEQTITFNLTLPNWFAKIKHKKPTPLYLQKDGFTTFENKETILKLNPQLLAPLAEYQDINWQVSVKDKLSPAIFKNEELGITAVIMPLRF